jgi:hypothetical protein
LIGITNSYPARPRTVEPIALVPDNVGLDQPAEAGVAVVLEANPVGHANAGAWVSVGRTVPS